MTKLDEIARQYPHLDLFSIRILLQIDALPGMSIREIADILQMSRKTAQLKIALMSTGRKNKSCRIYPLVDGCQNLADKRKRSLALTDAGETVAEYFNSLQ